MTPIQLPFRISARTRGNEQIFVNEFQVAYHNAGQVVNATLGVEKTLVMIISTRFVPEGGLRAKDFEDRILNTSWCSFEASRPVVTSFRTSR